MGVTSTGRSCVQVPVAQTKRGWVVRIGPGKEGVPRGRVTVFLFVMRRVCSFFDIEGKRAWTREVREIGFL